MFCSTEDILLGAPISSFTMKSAPQTVAHLGGRLLGTWCHREETCRTKPKERGRKLEKGEDRESEEGGNALSGRTEGGVQSGRSNLSRAAPKLPKKLPEIVTVTKTGEKDRKPVRNTGTGRTTREQRALHGARAAASFPAPMSQLQF